MIAAWVPVEWFDRYRHAIEEYHLPRGTETRQAYAEAMGRDGMQLLGKLWQETAPA